MSSILSASDALISRAQQLSNDFSLLIDKSTVLLSESQNVEQKITESFRVQGDEQLKNLVKYCNDDECIHQLLENAELKQTLDEYKAGIEHIMDKYRLHCQSDVLAEHCNLREKYVSGLQRIVSSLGERIEEMALLMIVTVGLEEHSSSENQSIIHLLTKENEMMRRQLQISRSASGKDAFQQAQPVKVDSGTQFDAEYDLPLNSESDSSGESFHSFLTCFSYSCESSSTVSVAK